MRKWQRMFCTTILAHAGGGVWAASASADAYPSRPLRMILGFSPGGVDDFVARNIAPKLSERLGQSVIVDNRPGAGSNLGAEITAHSSPDGYTLMLGSISTLATSRSLYPKLGYDLLKDFSFISLAAIGAQVLVANPSIPIRSVAELVALARSKPNTIRYGSAGVASSSHLTSEMLRSRAGIEILHVPYKSGGVISVALMAGEVDISFAGVASVMSLIKAKRVNALAIASANRVSALPDLPTVAESGYPGFEATNVLGIITPAGTPAAVSKRLNVEVRNVLRMDDVRAALAAQALEPAGSTPEEFRARAQADVALWARVIKDAKITLN